MTTLLSHYWTAEEAQQLRALQIEDWLDDLGEFPAQFVAIAVKEWRQGEHGRKRPTPSDIRLLCLAEQRKRQPSPERIKVTDQAQEPMPPDDVVRAYWQKIPFPRLTRAEREKFEAASAASIGSLPDTPFTVALNRLRPGNEASQMKPQSARE